MHVWQCHMHQSGQHQYHYKPNVTQVQFENLLHLWRGNLQLTTSTNIANNHDMEAYVADHRAATRPLSGVLFLNRMPHIEESGPSIDETTEWAVQALQEAGRDPWGYLRLVFVLLDDTLAEVAEFRLLVKKMRRAVGGYIELTFTYPFTITALGGPSAGLLSDWILHADSDPLWWEYLEGRLAEYARGIMAVVDRWVEVDDEVEEEHT